MDAKKAIISQNLASLEMLKNAIIACPESLWASPEDKNKFWHVAYHALFYTHLYLQPGEKDFTPWAKHRENHQYLGAMRRPPYTIPQIGEPYSKADTLDYLQICQEQVRFQVAAADLKAESGFDWLPFSKLELQLYNIRHLQQHTGELMERLGAREHIDVDWVSFTG